MSQNISLGYTSRLLNQAEVYYINGNPKTAIYSEINTNVQVGDKVFILNGIYDSQKYIDVGKYALNADGYTVLYTNNCQIVIDLTYTYSTSFTQSYYTDNLDNYKKIYNIETQREFDYINQIFVDSYTYSDFYQYNRISKFEHGLTNNIIYCSKTFSGIYSTNSIGYNNGISETNSFWSRIGNSWININYEFNSGTFSGVYNNGRIMIFGEDINYNGNVLKQRNIYKYNNTTYTWDLDILYKQPIVSKLSFQGGSFQGIHNDGIFGNYKSSKIWNNNGIWNSGFLVNSIWNSGVMNSKTNKNNTSYYSELVNNKVKQHFDYSNNNGYGYNYIIDSEIKSGTINNSNVFNSNIIGIDDTYIFDNQINNNITLNGGFYDFCNLKNVNINNSETLDTIINNSNVNNSQIYNSQINNSIVINSKLNGSNVLNIISADITYYYSETNENRGILKLYISENDFLRLDLMDNFYITNIDKNFVLNNLSLSQKLLMPYELRYVIDSIFNPDFNDNIIVSLKTPFDNNNITNINTNNNIFIDNPNKNYSIDIDFGGYLINNINLDKNNVNNLFRNAYISNGDINEGLIDSSEFINYNNINYNTNIISGSSSNLSISKINNTELLVLLKYPKEYSTGTLKIGNYVWLDSILYNNITDISSTYSIVSISYSNTNIYLGLSNSSIVSSLNSTGTYSISDGLFNKNYINTVKISNSNVQSGLFLGTLFKSTTFFNNNFVNNSLNYNNLSLLRLIGLNINDSSLLFNNATVKSSIINNATWNSSIAIDCIWNSTVFNDGIFYDGYWINGVFNNGLFTDNNGYILEKISYSDIQLYNNWNDGIFNSGTFYKSNWIKGTFNNGLFYNSNWYSGHWYNGILGDNSIPHNKTTFGVGLNFGVSQSYWYDGIVKNADVGGLGNIYWYDGIFYNGTFNSIKGTGSSIWYNGQFDGGDFTGDSIWEYGIFNGGKFLSTYKNNLINSTYSTDYSWKGGIFNEGLFGSQSTWYNGEFNGGLFNGIVWNNGVFSGGNFVGSGQNILLGSDIDYVNQFTQSFYGLWRNGIFSEKKQYKIYDTTLDIKETLIFDSGLWQNGLFDSTYGQFNNSAWLAGNFMNGNFKGGIFNPYCDSTLQGSTNSSYNLNIIPDDPNCCVWNGGNFYSGNFNFSNWNNGNFYNGNITGAVWNAGTWYYGNANNIYWVSGTWLNGQWNGSPYDYSILDENNNVKSGPEKQILSRIGLLNKDMHVNNVFTGTYSSIGTLGWTQSVISLSWISGSYSIYLPNFVYSNPIFKPSTIYPLAYQRKNFIYSEYAFSFQIGDTVIPGEVYSISFGNFYTISYTVVNYDTFNKVLLNLANLIKTDPYLSSSKVIWHYSENADVAIGNISNPVIRSGVILDQHELFIYYSSLRSDLIPSVTTSKVLNTSNQTSNILNFTIGSSSNIFSTASNYLITLDLESVGGSTEFLINYGNLQNIITLNGKQTYSIPLKQTNANLNKQSLNIQRTSIPFGNPTFSILSYNVKEYDIKYSNNCNIINQSLLTYPNITGSYFDMINGSTISLSNIDPSLVITHKVDTGDSTSGLLTINFGNGKFGSFPSANGVNTIIPNTSIWKGGSWNNGYWNSNPIELTNLSYLSIDNYTWNITLVADSSTNLASSKYSFTHGDNVLISNIIGIDINNNRVLITNLNKVLSVTPLIENINSNNVLSTITIQILTKYPIIRIEKDSLNHTIKITKTSWLSGIFTNGLFKGIWTYGMVKGYPYITRFENTHWIDGIFDGGTFKSISIGNSQSSGLIQNFTFRDNNIANKNDIGTNLGFKYNSWMDLLYDTSSMTNIYKNNYIYDQDYQLSIPDMNLNGYTTHDILSSKSYLRNSYDSNIVYYSLGSKYQIYSDFIGDGSIFNNSYSNQIIKLGLNKFYELGWTYSQDSNLNISSNTGLFNTDKLFLSNVNPNSKLSRIGIKYVIMSDGNVANNPNDQPSKTTTRIINTGQGNLVGFVGNFENTSRFKPLYYSNSHTSGMQYNVKAFNNIHNNISNNPENDGYYNPNTVDWDLLNNFGKSLSATSSNIGNTTDTLFYKYWKIPATDTYTMELKIPFILNLDDTYQRNVGADWGGFYDNSRGGGTVYFKLFGCIEYCIYNDVIENEDSWKILGTTYMTLDPNLKYTNSFNTYIKVGDDKYDGSINFDDTNIVSGLLTIDRFNFTFNKGDRVRFNVYSITGPYDTRSNNSIDNNIQTPYSDIGFNISGIDTSLNSSGTQMNIAFPGTRTYASITFNPTSQNIPLQNFNARYPDSKINQKILNYPYNNSGYFEIYTSTSVSYLENNNFKISNNRYSLSTFDIASTNIVSNSQPTLTISSTFSFDISNNEIKFPGLYSNLLKIGDYISLTNNLESYYFRITNIDLTSYQNTQIYSSGNTVITTNYLTILNTLENLPLIQDNFFTLTLINRIVIPNVFQLNTPKMYSPNRDIINYVKKFQDEKQTFFKEYFYNKNSFRFYLENSGDYQILFNKINFYEIDSIPFFNYWVTSDNINSDIAIPNIATMPNIDNTKNIYDIIGNISINFTQSVIGNYASNLKNYYLLNSYTFFALTGNTFSNYTTYSIINNIITVIGEPSSSLDEEIRINKSRLFINDTQNSQNYSYKSYFDGNDYGILNPSLTYSLLIYPTDDITTTQKSKYISAEIYNKDLSPLVNLYISCDYPDITRNTSNISTLKTSFSVNIDNYISSVYINNDWNIYINGSTISNNYRYKNLVTTDNKPIEMYNTDNKYIGYTFSTINDVMQKTYSVIYKPTITINGNTYSPDFYYINKFNVNPNAVINSVTYSFVASTNSFGNYLTYSYRIDNLIYSITASGRRYVTIEWSYNGGVYSYFTTSVSKSAGYNIYNINPNGKIDYTPQLPFDIYGKTYSFRITTTSSNYTSSLFTPSIYTFSIVYGK
jgi:hypothetical protein